MLIRSSWNPWSVFDELDRSLDSSTDIEDTEDETHLSFDVPGMTEDDIEITVTGTILTLRGQRTGRRAMTFERRFDLGTTYDLDDVRAHVANGVLTITLAKHARAKPRRIKLSSGVMDKVKGLLGNGKDKRAEAA